MKNIKYGTLIGLVVLVACTYYHLSRALPPEIKGWYELYSPLMSGQVPDWIDANHRTEGQHFLKMTTQIQKDYMYEYFWKIRQPGLQDLFEERLQYTSVFFHDANNPWQSDRARIYLLAGEPTVVRYYQEGRETVESGMPQSGDILLWIYWSAGIGETVYAFEFVPPEKWRLSMDTGLRGMANRDIFERRCRERFYPTKIGWEIYGDYLHDALEGK